MLGARVQWLCVRWGKGIKYPSVRSLIAAMGKPVQRSLAGGAHSAGRSSARAILVISSLGMGKSRIPEGRQAINNMGKVISNLLASSLAQHRST